MSTLETYRTEFRAASDEELLKRAAPPRGAAPALSAEAWLALTEEMERRGLVAPDDALADLALEEYQAAPVAGRPAREMRVGPVRYRKASIGKRLVAFLIDSFIAFAPVVLAFGLMFGALTNLAEAGAGVGFLLFVAAIGWTFYYRLTKDGRANGQSIGKSLLDLMVIDTETNRPCTRGKSALREIVMLGLDALPFGFLVEPIAAIVDDDGRRIGDRAANTQVIEVADYRPTGRPL